MAGIQELVNRMEGLANLVSDLAAQVHALMQHQAEAAVNVPAVPNLQVQSPRVKMLLPDRFSGDRDKFETFRESCRLYFRVNPHASQSQMVGIVVSLLQGDPQAWALKLPPGAPEWSDLDRFFLSLGTIYAEPDHVGLAASQILCIRQGNRSAEDYCSEFRKLGVTTAWCESALRAIFKNGLSEGIKDAWVGHTDPDSLEQAMALAVRIDRRLRDRQKKKSDSDCTPTSSVFLKKSVSPSKSPDPEPMDLDTTDPALRRAHRLKNRLCLYCGEPGHVVRNCSRKPSGKRLSLGDSQENHPGSQVPSCIKKLLIPVSLLLPSSVISCQAMVDSGASINLINARLVQASGITLCPLMAPFTINGADSTPLRNGDVRFRTTEIRVQIGALHEESLSFFVVPHLNYDLILGLPWLQLHNPVFDWVSLDLCKWGKDCSSHLIPVQIASCSPEGSCLPEFIQDFIDVFDECASLELPPHRPYDCSLDLLPDAKFPKGRIYNLSGPEREAMRDYVQKSLQIGHIRPSTSPVGAGFFFVKKKDGGLRPCIDYRELNKITVKDQHPLPLIPDLLNQVIGSSWFTKLDLRGAYNLIRIREGDEWKTAFNTPEGHFEYLVMPFGLSNAPAVFQRFVNDIFRDLLGRYVVVYLDDILIFSPDYASHVSHVREVLTRLRLNHLYAKLSKCLFSVQNIDFLGYVITPTSVSMDQTKVQAVLRWERPKTLKELQRFLGFSNYYRKFIKDFSVIAKPLTDLTKKGAFVSDWPPEALVAFQTLKDSFTSAPVLVHPVPDIPFIVEVDASETGVGAILSQGYEPFTKLHPIAFFSRKFSSSEKNYDVGNRELLAIKWALEEWRHFLEGAKEKFTVLTDHKNLLYLDSAKRLNPRQARWALFFSRFDFLVTFRPGSKNIKADALSRSFGIPDMSDTEPEGILAPGVVVATLAPNISGAIAAAQHDAPADTPPGLLFVPLNLRLRVLEEVHSSVLAGHPGIAGTSHLLSRNYWWPRWTSDVKNFVSACETCARSKVSRGPPEGLLRPLPTPARPWTHLSMDFVTDLPSSQGRTVVWVICDRFSKMCHLVALKKLPSAKRLARLFIANILRLHGVPQSVVSDRGVQFVSKFWRAFCGHLGISLSFSSAFHPETNGQTERLNQSFEQYLRCFVSECQDKWSDFLPMAEFALNNQVHSSTRLSPFYCCYGFNPKFSSGSGGESCFKSPQDIARRLCTVWAGSLVTLKKAQDNMSKYANKKRRPGCELSVGDKVWLSTKNLRLRLPSHKLGPKFIGPFSITEIINPVTFRLALPSSMRIHPVFHRSLLKRYVCPVSPRTPPSPIVVSGELEFEVEKILDSRLVQGSLQYLVHWKGYGPEERTWVPSRVVHASRLVRQFHQKYPDRPGGNVEGSVTPPKRGGSVMRLRRRAAPGAASHLTSIRRRRSALPCGVGGARLGRSVPSNAAAGRRTSPRLTPRPAADVSAGRPADQRH